MSNKTQLRQDRLNTVINTTSKQQEESLTLAVSDVCDALQKKIPGIQLLLVLRMRA